MSIPRNLSKLADGADSSGVLGVAYGGTGQTTANAGLNSLLPSQSGNANKYLQTDGSNTSWDAISLSTADITGVLGTSNGGTGLSSFTANGVAYASGTGTLATGSALTFDGTTLQVANGDVYAVNGTGSNLSIGFKQSSAVKFRLRYDIAGDSISLVDASGNFCQTWSQGNTYTLFGIGGAEQMRLTSTGLGIGTSSPARKLQVNSSGAVAARFTRSGGTVANNSLEWFDGTNGWYAGVSGSNFFGIAYNSSGAIDSAALRLDSLGNLGLGVTPSAWGGAKVFQIAGGSMLSFGVGALEFWQNVYYNGTNTIYQNTAPASTYVQTLGQHRWFNAPSNTAGTNAIMTQAMTLDVSGNLLIGTTTSSEKITVDGNIRLVGNRALIFQPTSSVAVGAMSFRNGSGVQKCAIGSYYNVADEGALEFVGPTNSTNMLLTSNGNLLVGTTSSTTGIDTNSTRMFVVAPNSNFGAALTTVGDNQGRGIRFTDQPKVVIGVIDAGFDKITFGSNTSHPITFITAGSEKSRIDPSGNLLIGSTSTRTSAKLDIRGDVMTLGSNANYYGIIDYNAGVGLLSLASESGGGIRFLSGSTERVRITSSGVGIGTTSPGNYMLNVQASILFRCGFLAYTPDGLFGANALPSRIDTPGSGQILFGYTDGGGGQYAPRIGFGQTAPNTAAQNSIGNVIDGSLTFNVGASNTERARINPSGNFGIGLSSPQFKLDVFRGSSGVVLNLDGENAYNAETGIALSSGRAKISGFLNGSGGTPGSTLRFYTMPDGGSVTERGRFTSAGDFQLYITPAKDGQVQWASGAGGAVQALIYANGNPELIAQCGGSGGVKLTGGATSWVSASDIRNKNIIEPITNAITKIAKLSSIIYSFKDDEQQTRRVGLVAQELLEVLPEAVYVPEKEEELMGVRYTEVIPLLVSAIQEQQAMIQQLQADIAELKNK